jgi:alkanesulfonate monooxygenase
MPVRLHWFLPTNGDSRTDLSLGNAVGAHGARIDSATTTERKGDVGYMAQVARAAEAMASRGP